MRRALSFFLTAFSFSLGLTAGAIANRPIEEPVSEEPAALNLLASDGAVAESDAEVSGSGEDPELQAGARSTEPSADKLGGDDFVNADGAAVFRSNEGAPLDAVAEEDATGAVERLARVFARMSPRDAAPVLSNLSDAEVRVILMQVPDRIVAEILASLEPERAARLTRLLIRAGEVGRE